MLVGWVYGVTGALLLGHREGSLSNPTAHLAMTTAIIPLVLSSRELFDQACNECDRLKVKMREMYDNDPRADSDHPGFSSFAIENELMIRTRTTLLYDYILPYGQLPFTVSPDDQYP